jgi:hypothetical protein
MLTELIDKARNLKSLDSLDKKGSKQISWWKS